MAVWADGGRRSAFNAKPALPSIWINCKKESASLSRDFPCGGEKIGRKTAFPANCFHVYFQNFRPANSDEIVWAGGSYILENHKSLLKQPDAR